MKAYIIYKFEDREIVKNKLNDLKSNCTNFEPLMLPEVPSKRWKFYAKKKIKEADCAIYFVGKNSSASKNIDWELTKFIKRDKPIYTLKLDENCNYNKVLFRKSFSNMEIVDKNTLIYAKSVDEEKLVKIINNNLELDVSDEIKSHIDMDPAVLIEQYKAYLQTSEDVVARRQAVSNFYITLNATLISVLSTIVTVLNLIGKTYSILITIIGCYVIPILGFMLCYNWRRLVYSYGQLNAAKMKVISAIEKNLPFNIYDVEWKVQNDRLGKRKYVSFTIIERLIPLLFAIIYCMIFLVAIVLTILFL